MGSIKVYRTKTEQATGLFRLLDIAKVAENREDLPVSLQVYACSDGSGAL